MGKKINSTKNTFNTGATSLSCKLKEPCSKQNPVFLVQGLNNSTLNYNYCKWGGHCYWIDEIRYITNNIVEVSCHMDVLGTYKDNIIAEGVAYVEYTSNPTFWNKKVDDIRLNPEVQFPTGQTPATTQFDFCPNSGLAWDKTGTIVMKVMSYPTGLKGGARCYAMTPSQAASVFADLNDLFYNNVTGSGTVIEGVAKCWGNMGGMGSWVDNILSVIWLPISKDSYKNWGTEQDDMVVGTVPCAPSSGKIVKLDPITMVQGDAPTLALPWDSLHTDLEFLKNPRWNTLQFIYPGGCQSLDVTNLKDQTSLGWWMAIDVCSGEWAGKFTERGIDSSQVLATCSGSLGVDVRALMPTHSDDMNYIGLGAAMVGLAAGGIAGIGMLGIGAGIGSAVMAAGTDVAIGAGIGGAFSNMAGGKVAAASGSLGGGAAGLFAVNGGSGGSFGKCYLTPVFYRPWGIGSLTTYQSFCAEQGYPCGAMTPLSNFANYYVKCVQADLRFPQAAILKKNLAEINQYLNTTGVFLE